MADLRTRLPNNHLERLAAAQMGVRGVRVPLCGYQRTPALDVCSDDDRTAGQGRSATVDGQLTAFRLDGP